MLPLPILDLKDFQDKFATHFRPWQRSFQFWVRAADIYTGYKVFQLRVSFVKDVQKQEEMWERQHELAADKIYAMCADLGGFFLKVAQIIGKPDLAPAAWVRRLVTLCDQAPATPFDAVQHVLEKEFGRSLWEMFERFDEYPLGSASIAQVHRARLKGDKSDVVVKVQHPGIQDLMMTDIHNLQAFALYMQKTDIKFDLYSITKEMEKQIGYEFDFMREANAMEKLRCFLYENNKKTPVLVPWVVRDMVTRRALVMEYIDGIPILNLGDEIAKRGINPSGKVAAAAKQKILKSLTLAYGQMILKNGFFHADPHPGNILICKGSEASEKIHMFSFTSFLLISKLKLGYSVPAVALLDYGQVKDLPNALRLGYANLVLAIADGDPVRASESYRELGIKTVAKCKNGQEELFKLAQTMFDTKLPPGVTMLQPFSEDSSIKKISVEAFPEELFSILRTVHLLRGLSVGMGVNYSCAEQWRPLAEEALCQAGRLKEATLVKLKLGSRRDLSPPSEQMGHIDAVSVSSSASMEPMKIDESSSSANTSQDSPEFTSSLTEEVMSIDTDCYSPVSHLSSRETLLASSPKVANERTISVLYLFSKFKNAHQAVSLASEDSTSTMENGFSVGISPIFSSCQSLDISEQQSEQGSVTSLPVRHS
ncbi:hypothetical protein TIFTF001_033457 [Ficus carica]|uniref:ABC1 atypical kinase-like domain-containing protein n=1 Tax=Ficus carica TaxID=3494 RepID=A0AA88E0R2_FICCA|nr:hypothetical protein TIFTF001_033457 [Ficus carica]